MKKNQVKSRKTSVSVPEPLALRIAGSKQATFILVDDGDDFRRQTKFCAVFEFGFYEDISRGLGAPLIYDRTRFLVARKTLECTKRDKTQVLHNAVQLEVNKTDQICLSER